MYSKVSTVQMTQAARKAHEDKWGRYNDPPPNFQPCSANEFWHWHSMYGVYADREFRQFVVPGGPNKWMESVQLFYGAGDTGYGLFTTHKYVPSMSGPAKVHEVYEYTPHFYKFYLCDHEVKHLRNVGDCLNEYTCTKCGWTYEVDSSG
jgi:hypothetical protein